MLPGHFGSQTLLSFFYELIYGINEMKHTDNKDR